MIVILLAASLASPPLADDVAFAELRAGRNQEAVARIESGAASAKDPARLINLGIAYARNGDRQKARALFLEAYRAREWVELETATGAWVDSRVLARRALAMLDSGELDSGELNRAGLFARN